MQPGGILKVMKVFIFDPLWPKLVDEKLEEKLSSVGAETIIITEVKPLAETTELFEGNEARILCLNPDYVDWKLTNADYEKIPNLSAILTASTGFEWIEQDSANERGIPIVNIKNFSTDAVAEWAVLMMFSLARQLPRLIKDDFPLDYDKDYMKYRGVNLEGKTAGIVGLGHIGSAIARRCKGLGMNVVYYSRSSQSSEYQQLSLAELFSQSDIIFPTMAKNDQTLQLIPTEMLESMKPSAIVVDIAHGLIDHDKIVEMVRTSTLFGYGFEAKTGEFSQYEGNIWSVPAYAWATKESMYNSEVELVENIAAAVHGKFPNRVN